MTVLFCDDKKLPNGILTPYHQHSRQLTVLNTQLGLSKPFKKRVCQQIVKQKIWNQGLCLEHLERDGVAGSKGFPIQ